MAGKRSTDTYGGLLKVNGECPMEKPNIVKCAICEEYYTRDAMCEATVSGRYERVCLTCLHKIESRSQQALGEDTSGPESEEPIEESESEE